MPVSTGGSYVPGLSYDRTGATDTAGIYLNPAISGGTSTTKEVVTTITGDGAIAVATGLVVLTKGSAAAITMTAPTAAQIGTRTTVVAGSAFAHVITATGLIDDGITGGSKSTMTFAAFIGASITLVVAQVGKYAVESKNVVTIT